MTLNTKERAVMAKLLRAVRKVIRRQRLISTVRTMPTWPTMYLACVIMGLIFTFSGCIASAFETNCYPKTGYTCADIVNAIGKAENSKAHPYGIMVKYKRTDPWQACMNTVKHRMRDYIKSGSSEDFVVYLSKTYAPIGASNDPKGLNRNWISNVRYYLAKGV